MSLKPGDVVRLKSGSRRLTVVEVGPLKSVPQSGPSSDGPIRVTVGWFRGGMAYNGAFPPEALYRPLLSRLLSRLFG